MRLVSMALEDDKVSAMEMVPEVLFMAKEGQRNSTGTTASAYSYDEHRKKRSREHDSSDTAGC